MGAKIVSFGEIMLRLNPEGYLRIIQADTFHTSYTGAEANVCVALSRWGCDTNFVTAMPENDISECALMTMKKYGVGVSDVVIKPGRMGLYYLEKGASQRPSKVIYDRKYSSLSNCVSGDFDWDKIMEGADWFHFTGITPPLGEHLPELCREACEAAKRNGAKISIDLNYRKTLWSEERAQQVMQDLIPYADVLFGNEEDAEKCLGIKSAGSNVIKGQLNREGYIESAKAVAEQYGCKTVVYSLRTSKSASDNIFQGMIYQDGKACFSKAYDMHIVDRVGGGDSFAAAAIYAMIHGYNMERAVEFATAAACLKHSIMQDFDLVSVKEIEDLVGGDGSGRVQR